MRGIVRLLLVLVILLIALCVSNIVCVFFLFFILSEVLMNKDVYNVQTNSEICSSNCIPLQRV